MAKVCNVTQWIEDNKKYFKPPVGNKMMHKEGQMKSFFVGGPNRRKDFHIECGEELFYQMTGDMILKVVEKGKHRDVHIKEGQIFLLPGRIQHSPQRLENTVGLVIERERHIEEKDGLRYFIEKEGELTTDSLFEKWFYCTDLGTQLVPIIEEFFASEQYKTGQPLPGSIPEHIPLELDMDRELEEPFSLAIWLADHSKELDETGKVQLFDGSKYQFQVYVYGKGPNTDKSDVAETWIWQLEGGSSVDLDGAKHDLSKNDSILVPVGKRFTVCQNGGSRTLVCYQDQTKSSTWPQDS